MAQRLTDLELEAWQALLHTHHQVMAVLESELTSEESLTMAQYDVLLRLARAEGRCLQMTELARRIMISPSGLTRVVDGLVDRDFVERERIGSDARVVHARLTNDGLTKIRQAAQTHLRGIREHFTGRLSESQQRSVATILQIICGPHVPH